MHLLHWTDMRYSRIGALVILALIPHSTAMAECSKERSDVYETVDKYLHQGYINSGGRHGDVKIRSVVQTALAGVVSQRSSDKFSQDERLRNAEYFLQGFNANTTDELSTEMTVKFLGPAYDGMKYYAHSLKDKGIPWVEQILRNDPDVPTSPPGGWTWAEEGMRASARLKGDAAVPKSDAKNLDFGLPCMNGRKFNFEINYDKIEKLQNPPLSQGNPYFGVPIIIVDSFGVGGKGSQKPRVYVRECPNGVCPGDD